MTYDHPDTELEIRQFKKIADSLVELKARKANDYGNSWRVFGLMGIVYQIGSKFIRIWNITNRGIATRNEPLRDSFRDIAVYAIMAMQMLDDGFTGDAFTNFGKKGFAYTTSSCRDCKEGNEHAENDTCKEDKTGMDIYNSLNK